MPRRKNKARRRRRGRNTGQHIDYVGHSYYSAGAGQISITPKKLGVILGRPHRLVSFSVTVCLRSDTGMVPAEAVSFAAYDPSLQKDSVPLLRRGPYIIDGRHRTFRFRVPYYPPFTYDDQTASSTKVISIYDYGDNSKAGMMVSVRSRFAIQDPLAPQMGLDVPEREHQSSSFAGDQIQSLQSSLSRISLE